MKFDEPSKVSLDTSLYLAKEKWGEEKGIHLRAKNEDWASICETDELSYWIRFLLYHPFSLRMMVSLCLVLVC